MVRESTHSFPPFLPFSSLSFALQGNNAFLLERGGKRQEKKFPYFGYAKKLPFFEFENLDLKKKPASLDVGNYLEVFFGVRAPKWTPPPPLAQNHWDRHLNCPLYLQQQQQKKREKVSPHISHIFIWTVGRQLTWTLVRVPNQYWHHQSHDTNDQKKGHRTAQKNYCPTDIGTTRATPTATPLVAFSDGGQNLGRSRLLRGFSFCHYFNTCSGVRTTRR